MVLTLVDVRLVQFNITFMAVFDEILKLMSVFFSMETGSPFMTLVGLCRWDLGWESWLKDRLKRSKRATSKSILTGWFSILLSVRWICIIHQNKLILIGTAWKNCALGFSFYLFYDVFIANLRHISLTLLAINIQKVLTTLGENVY